MKQPAPLVMQFPGQGSVHRGMGVDLPDHHPAARAVYEHAQQHLGLDVAALAATSTTAQLSESRAAQLCIFVQSQASFAILGAEGIQPDLVAGHSLGELSALTAAGVLSPGDGLALVFRRGELFDAACRTHPGSMVALRGLSLAEAEGFVETIEDADVLGVANVNGEKDCVLSGSRAALDLALRAARQQGIKAMPLNVHGAFHSPLMTEAAEAFARDVDAVELWPPHCPVISSATGEAMRDVETIRGRLRSQILDRVRWDLVLRTIEATRPSLWLEVGPGKALSGLLLRRDRRAPYAITATARSLDAAMLRVRQASGGTP